MRPDRRDALAMAFLALFAVLWLSRFFPLFDEQHRDEALLTEPAFRLLLGQVPYRDFRTHAPPLPAVVVVPFYAVLGVRVVAHKIPMVLQFVALAWLVYGLGRRLAGRVAALGAAFTVLGFHAMAWPILSHHWLSVLGLLALARVLLDLEETPTARRLAAAGALTGVAFLTAPNAGLAALAVCLAWLVARRGARPGAGSYAAGLGAVLGLFVLLMALAGALGPWLEEATRTGRHVRIHRQAADLAVMAAPFHLLAEALRQSPGRLVSGFYLWMAQLYGMTALAGTFLGLGGLLALASALRAARRSLSPAAWILGGLAVAWGVPLLAYHFIPTYMNFLGPFLVLLALELGGHAWEARPSLRRGLVGLGIGLLGILNSFAPCLATWLHRDVVHPIPFNAGTLLSASPEEAREWTALQEWVNRTTPPGEPLLYIPLFNLAGFDVLVGRENAAPFENLVPWLEPGGPDGAAEIRAQVATRRPRLMILPKVNPEARLDRLFADRLLELYGQIMPGYRPVWQSEGYLVLVREDPGSVR